MPEISVIMGVYNELNKDILMEAVNSILHQTFEDFEFMMMAHARRQQHYSGR